MYRIPYHYLNGRFSALLSHIGMLSLSLVFSPGCNTTYVNCKSRYITALIKVLLCFAVSIQRILSFIYSITRLRVCRVFFYHVACSLAYGGWFIVECYRARDVIIDVACCTIFICRVWWVMITYCNSRINWLQTVFLSRRAGLRSADWDDFEDDHQYLHTTCC